MSSGLIWKLYAIPFVLMSVVDFGSGQEEDFLNPHDCLNSGNYTATATYRANLNATLSALSSNATRYGYYSAAAGHGQDRAYAVALCRADIRTDQCRACAENAAVELVQLCPDRKQAIRWYEFCTLHYSNRPITGIPIIEEGHGLINTADVKNPVQFRKERTALLDALRLQAANGSSVLKVGAGIWNTSDSDTIYALLQCVPTLSFEECNNCLSTASQGLNSASQGARALRTSCNLRYELYTFYNETRLRELGVQPLQIPRTLPEGRSKKDDCTTKIVIIIGVFIAACAVVFLTNRTMMRSSQEIPKNIDEKSTVESTDEISTVDFLQYDFGQIRAATNDFADANKLGQGGSGGVYKGKLLNGRVIVVKRLSRQDSTEFVNEVKLEAKLHHKNLVELLGFSQEGTKKLLVYEFVPNGSLDLILFDPKISTQLDWERRYKIIEGIARGLVYLHEDSRIRIVHGNLKASNILLDGEMNPKIADFSAARLFEPDEIQGKTTKVVGTYGDMSPEYTIHGKFSIKSDVFSFGVLVLEIVSGQQNINNHGEKIEDLLSFTWRNWYEGRGEDIIDPVLRAGRGCMHDMLRCIHIGLLCVQEDAVNRPAMISVFLMLSNSTVTLPVPSQPAFVM